MDDEYQAIYRDHAEAYDELVEAEDCDGNLLSALAAVAPLAGAQVLEVGVGSGRIARQLLPQVARLVGLDRAPAMLAVARRHLATATVPWALLMADARALPVVSAGFDLAIAGWVFGHFRAWMPTRWQHEVGRALDEMQRALRRGGTQVILETLGTGVVEVAPPPDLLPYYAWLEGERGFTRVVLRTDYLFADVETAARVTGFFFQRDFAARVRVNNWQRIPEWTGLWWRRG